MTQPETRPSLIVRLKGKRNELAWAEFVSTYESFLKQLVSRQGVPPQHVDDVTQQILVGIARSVDGWEDDGNPASFRRWVSRVARNVVIKFMTRERRQCGGQGGTDFFQYLHNVPEAPDPQQARAYEYELILWAAGEVKCQFREVSWRAFWATFIEDRPVGEVAEELGLTPGSIYMSRSRIMARIRSKIQEVDS